MSVQDFRPRVRPEWAIIAGIDFDDRVKTFGPPYKGVVVSFHIDDKIVNLRAGKTGNGKDDYIVPIPIDQIKMSR